MQFNSARSKNSTRSKKSNKSNTSTRRSKNRKTKERSRTNSGSHSRTPRTSKKQRDRSNSTNSEDFFTGESDEEFVSISSNSDKAPRVSWTCEHCTYVNNPGVKVRLTRKDSFHHFNHYLGVCHVLQNFKVLKRRRF